MVVPALFLILIDLRLHDKWRPSAVQVPDFDLPELWAASS